MRNPPRAAIRKDKIATSNVAGGCKLRPTTMRLSKTARALAPPCPWVEHPCRTNSTHGIHKAARLCCGTNVVVRAKIWAVEKTQQNATERKKRAGHTMACSFCKIGLLSGITAIADNLCHPAPQLIKVGLLRFFRGIKQGAQVGNLLA